MKRVLAMITPVSHARIEGVSRYAHEHGWLLTIHDRLAGTPPGTDYDGVIVTLRSDERVAGFVRRMAKGGVPVVDMTIERPRVKLPRVISDHGKIGFLAGEHFKECGFQSAAWFSTGWTNVHALRFAGLAESLGRTPLKWVIPGEAETIRTLKAAYKPVSVLAYSEAEAVRLLHLCLAARLDVPDDVAILGVDDEKDLCESCPVPLSSIKIEHYRLGRTAMHLILRMLEGGPRRDKVILCPPVRVIERASTKRSTPSDKFVASAVNFIRTARLDTLDVMAVVKACGASRSYLEKRFRAETGRTILDAIHRRTMEDVKHLLLDTDKSVAVIAQETGFPSASGLCSMFRRLTGQSTSEFRATRQPR